MNLRKSFFACGAATLLALGASSALRAEVEKGFFLVNVSDGDWNFILEPLPSNSSRPAFTLTAAVVGSTSKTTLNASNKEYRLPKGQKIYLNFTAAASAPANKDIDCVSFKVLDSNNSGRRFRIFMNGDKIRFKNPIKSADVWIDVDTDLLPKDGAAADDSEILTKGPTSITICSAAYPVATRARSGAVTTKKP
jgi:hypothetical protein